MLRVTATLNRNTTTIAMIVMITVAKRARDSTAAIVCFFSCICFAESSSSVCTDVSMRRMCSLNGVSA